MSENKSFDKDSMEQSYETIFNQIIGRNPNGSMMNQFIDDNYVITIEYGLRTLEYWLPLEMNEDNVVIGNLEIGLSVDLSQTKDNVKALDELKNFSTIIDKYAKYNFKGLKVEHNFNANNSFSGYMKDYIFKFDKISTNEKILQSIVHKVMVFDTHNIKT